MNMTISLLIAPSAGQIWVFALNCMTSFNHPVANRADSWGCLYVSKDMHLMTINCAIMTGFLQVMNKASNE